MTFKERTEAHAGVWQKLVLLVKYSTEGFSHFPEYLKSRDDKWMFPCHNPKSVSAPTFCEEPCICTLALNFLLSGWREMSSDKIWLRQFCYSCSEVWGWICLSSSCLKCWYCNSSLNFWNCSTDIDFEREISKHAWWCPVGLCHLYLFRKSVSLITKCLEFWECSIYFLLMLILLFLLKLALLVFTGRYSVVNLVCFLL